MKIAQRAWTERLARRACASWGARWDEQTDAERERWCRVAVAVVELHEGVGINHVANPPPRKG